MGCRCGLAARLSPWRTGTKTKQRWTRGASHRSRGAMTTWRARYSRVPSLPTHQTESERAGFVATTWLKARRSWSALPSQNSSRRLRKMNKSICLRFRFRMICSVSQTSSCPVHPPQSPSLRCKCRRQNPWNNQRRI